MKNILFLMIIFSLSGFSQTKIKPSQISNATKQSFKEVLDINKLETSLDLTNTVLNTKIDSTSLSSATDEFYNKPQSNARFINEDGDTITGTILVPTPAAGTNTTQVVNANFVQSEKSIQSDLTRLGWPVKTIPFGYKLGMSGTPTDLTSGTVYLVMQDILWGNITISSIKAIIQQQGNFTDNGSIAGIYTFSSGVYTKVAETSNIATELQKSAGSIATFTLTIPYTAPAGTILCYAIMYKYVTTQTTAPRLYNSGSISGVYNCLQGGASTSLAKAYATLSGQTSLPATINATATGQGTYPWLLFGF
jgi:hypothetical protein